MEAVIRLVRDGSDVHDLSDFNFELFLAETVGFLYARIGSK